MENQTEPNRPTGPLANGAQIFSDVFSPLIIPTYGMAIAMWLTPLRTIPESSRLIFTLLIACITGLIPLVFIIVLMRVGKVADMDISNRHQRMAPLMVALICYLFASWILQRAHAPAWLSLFFCGAAIAVAVAGIITPFWKISAHTTSIGGLVGLLAWLAVAGIADVNAMAMLTAGILLAGLMGTSRLILRRHTIGQVTAGFFLGLACTFGLDLLLCS